VSETSGNGAGIYARCNQLRRNIVSEVVEAEAFEAQSATEPLETVRHHLGMPWTGTVHFRGEQICVFHQRRPAGAGALRLRRSMSGQRIYSS
jgi:hypothetical protein